VPRGAVPKPWSPPRQCLSPGHPLTPRPTPPGAGGAGATSPSFFVPNAPLLPAEVGRGWLPPPCARTALAPSPPNRGGGTDPRVLPLAGRVRGFKGGWAQGTSIPDSWKSPPALGTPRVGGARLCCHGAAAPSWRVPVPLCG